MRCEVFTTSLTLLLFMSTDQEGVQIIGDSIYYHWSGVAIWPGQYLVLLTLRHAQICLYFKWAEMSCDFLYNQPPPCPPTRGSLCPALWSAGELKENNLTALAAGIFQDLKWIYSLDSPRGSTDAIRDHQPYGLDLPQITPQYLVLSNVKTCTDMSSYSEWAEISQNFLYETQLLFIPPVSVFRRKVHCKITHNNPQ